jgi:cell pole-organizing protein PopZ
MEEILASIRRIIADDEAKPAAAEKVPPPAAPPAPAKPAPAPVARAADNAPPPAAPPVPPKAAASAPPPPAPAATNSQDDIDALLNGLDEATTPEEIRTAAPEPDVLDLTDEMALPEPPPAVFKKVEPPDDLEFTEAPPKAAPPRELAFDLPPPSPMDSAPILSRSTVSAVESAFNSLAHTVLSNNARTLEDLVKEMLRPMLKSWLDDNLPGLVERIVRAEIERVSRGR